MDIRSGNDNQEELNVLRKGHLWGRRQVQTAFCEKKPGGRRLFARPRCGWEENIYWIFKQ